MDWYRDGENTQRVVLTKQEIQTALNPAETGELDLLEKDEVKAKRPSMWNVVFYNDDYTPMDFVEFVLKTVFHISTLDALALTLAVHTKGKGIAGTYTFEVAEQKQCEVLLIAKIEEHPLRVEVGEGLDDSPEFFDPAWTLGRGRISSGTVRRFFFRP